MRLLPASVALIAAWSMVLLGCAGTSQPPPQEPDPDAPVEMPPFAKHASLRLLLAQARYDELEAALEQFRAASLWSIEEGEYRLVHAYKAFDVSDADVGEHITEWIEERPKSYQAHTAHAFHNVSKALDARGDRLAKDTSQEQFRVMRRLLKQAEGEVRAALALQPRNIAAYRALVVIARYSGDRFGTLTDEALRAFPESGVLRGNTLVSLQPKWHGSLALMEEFARRSQEHIGRNPDLKGLLGYPDWARGEILRGEKRFDEAIEMYTKAIETGGEEVEYVTGRSVAARGARRYDMAIADARRAIELYPWIADQEETVLSEALSSARRYANQQYADGNSERAVQAWSALLDYDPKDKEALGYRGQALCESGKTDAGIADLDRLLGIDPEYGSALQALVECYVPSEKVVEGIKRMEARLLRAPGNHLLRLSIARLYLVKNDLKSAAGAYAVLCGEDYGNACARLERVTDWVRKQNPKWLELLPTDKRALHAVERLAPMEEYEAYMQSLEESGQFNGRKAQAKFVARPSPMFPAWAMDHVKEGSVKAKLFLRADGSVAGVRILSAKPAGYFELAAMTALLQWKVAPSAQGFVATQDVEFRMAP